ncbi:FkbM family methyltransferase [Selenomonas sp. KH1T6]|uniref:FkbM family methyltransferase n=1 Tax=Selenomonas sp. KH1T6 TaxID=3158784 RepID=UPI0008A81039|nr:methyltransferase, FkbM family [Selenomonas ruminantium]
MQKYALYGAGEYGRAAFHVLSSKGDQVSCWVDGDEKKRGRTVLGCPVISLQDWMQLEDGSKLVLAVSMKHQREIEKMLHSYGIEEYEVFDRSLLYNRERLVSYAHPNDFEDIILYPVLKDVASKMFYIDVGCNDPCAFSVTKMYYDMGAHGINLDPISEYIDMAKRERPRDVNLCLGIGETPGKMEVFLNSGLSTMNRDVAEKGGFWGTREVEVKTLAQICYEHVPEGQEVHLMKIDVEGGELQVINGMDWQKCMPWVLCIESTYPDTDIPCYDVWEHLVLDVGYKLAFTYGVNRYYISGNHRELAKLFLPLETILQKYYVFHADIKRM